MANNARFNKPVKALFLEDSDKDFNLTKEQLNIAGCSIDLSRAETENEFTSSLRNQSFDVIISDFKLSGFDAFNALHIRNKICPETPFICFSGSIGEETAIQLVKAGAVDYVIKDRPDRLPMAIDRALVEVREKILRNQANEDLKNAYHDLKANQKKLQKTLESIIHVMGHTVELRDPYTAGHQRRVAKLAGDIAEMMNLPADRIRGVRMAGEIHDLGKIYVPAETLTKPSKLTSLEYKIIKLHPKTGHDILKEIDFSWPIAEIVYQHHERMNGSGYPRSLHGDGILLEARVIAVADVVEAMVSHRPYRPALGLDKALAEIRDNRGVLFATEVVDACIALFNRGEYHFTAK